MSKNVKEKKRDELDTKLAAQALEKLLAAGYVNKKKLYLQNFIRGIFFSLGSILGATIIIALLLWILSVLGNIPFIGDVVQNARDTIDTN